jgi:hypothetical protein
MGFAANVKMGNLSIFLKQFAWQLQSIESVETKCRQRTYIEMQRQCGDAPVAQVHSQPVFFA